MMIFNPDQCNFLIKQGTTVIGAGKHKKTFKFYVFFKQDDVFNKAMTDWATLCKNSRK